MQVATGAIKYITLITRYLYTHVRIPLRLLPHPRSYPLHLHLVRSLIHVARHSHTYIPLAPHLLPILTSTLTSKSKASTLRPLDFETTLRAPQQYLHTHVYTESLAQEAAFLTAEWLSVRARWASEHRAGVTFAPGKTAAVDLWEADLPLDDAPLGKYVRVLRKTRERQRMLVEKARPFLAPPICRDSFVNT